MTWRAVITMPVVNIIIVAIYVGSLGRVWFTGENVGITQQLLNLIQAANSNKQMACVVVLNIDS